MKPATSRLRGLLVTSLLLSAASTAWAQGAPVIISISPTSVSAGSGPFTLTLLGQNFVPGCPSEPGSIVKWTDSAGKSTLLGTDCTTSQCAASVPGGLIYYPGTVSISVVNPGGATSNAVPFTITPARLTIDYISPISAAAGGPGFLLAVMGTGFVSGSKINWTDPAGARTDLTADFRSPIQLTTNVPAILINLPGKARITVTNPGGEVSNGVDFTINPGALRIATTSLPEGTVGVAYSQTLLATGGKPGYTWSLASGTLPPGLSLGAPSGVISGTPTTAGTFTFMVQVTDTAQATAAQQLSLTIRSAAPRIATASLPNGTVGTPYSQSLAAEGGTPPYTWAAEGSLPAGLALSLAGVLSGTPTSAGTFNFTVRVTDSARAAATRVFALSIDAPRLAISTTSPLPAGTVAVAYSQTLAATGGAAPYTWSISAGSLPGGLALAASTGVISGTPNAAGAATFTVQVTDSARATASQTFSLTIRAAALTVTTTSPLADGTVGTSYSRTLAATGGSPPYSWRIESGALPQGLSLNASTGVLSGTPAVAGTFSFTIRVTDSASASASRVFALTIGVPPPPGVTFTGLQETGTPAQQPRLGLTLAAAYPLPITGQVTLTFTADAVVNADDQMVRFANGRRTVDFRIEANSRQATFDQNNTPQFSCGTVAGTIQLTVRLMQGSTDITPRPVPSYSVKVNRLPPAITTVTAVRTGSGLEVQVVGWSTPRQVTQARFRFAGASGANLQGADAVVPVDGAFANWFRDARCPAFGSEFRYTQPFSVQGNTSQIISVTVTLTNDRGESQSVTANF